MSYFEFALVVPGDISSGRSGTMSSTRTSTWNAIDRDCTRENCVFFDQISLTATGLLVTLSGGSFGGEIISRRFCHILVLWSQFTSNAEFTTPRGEGRKNSLKLSVRLEPKPVIAKTG